MWSRFGPPAARGSTSAPGTASEAAAWWRLDASAAFHSSVCDFWACSFAMISPCLALLVREERVWDEHEAFATEERAHDGQCDIDRDKAGELQDHVVPLRLCPAHLVRHQREQQRQADHRVHRDELLDDERRDVPVEFDGWEPEQVSPQHITQWDVL